MKRPELKLAIITIVYLSNHSLAKILRNNALMDRMVSHFQKDRRFVASPETETPPTRQPTRILSIMKNVLCKNFPSIPCDLILKDETLQNLLEESVNQIEHRSRKKEKTTAPSTLLPVINSEDLSNFLQVSNTGYFQMKASKKSPKTKNRSKKLRGWSGERGIKKYKRSKAGKKAELYSSRKQIRKFYPHKIKYRHKNKKNFRKYSKEEASMSVEMPDLKKKSGGFKSVIAEDNEAPVWRIDYMKHGEPSLNMFAYENDPLKGRIKHASPNVKINENVLEQTARKDVLHPDIYIQTGSFMRKSAANSEGTD